MNGKKQPRKAGGDGETFTVPSGGEFDGAVGGGPAAELAQPTDVARIDESIVIERMHRSAGKERGGERVWYVASVSGAQKQLLLGPFFDRNQAEAAMQQGAVALCGSRKEHKNLKITAIVPGRKRLPTGQCNDEVLSYFKLQLQVLSGHDRPL